jgi:hypothetical protein
MDHVPPRTRRSALVLLVGVVGLLLLAACSGSKPKPEAEKPFNPLSSTTSTTLDPNALHLPPDFQLPDTRFVSLLPVNGRPQPTPPIPVVGGQATVDGTVNGPSGPVAGATVRIERWVGSASGAIMVSTDGAGHFQAGGLLGGHYKVRAWLQPSLSTFDAATGFVANNGHLTVTVTMQQHNSFTVQVAATTGVATVGQAFTVEALVTQEQVNADGIVVDGPVNGEQVSLSSDPSVKITGANPGSTGADGLASWTVTCTKAGSFNATASTKDGNGSSGLPPCQPSGSSSTTSTTAPGTIDLPIGGSFTTPDPGPYPAGTYTADRSDCSTSYQVFRNGQWRNAHSSGDTLHLQATGQDFVPDPGSPSCTYTRIS